MASSHKDAGVSHPGISCDGCRESIHGVRYKCFVCPKYDLCSACEERGFHYEHDLIEIAHHDALNLQAGPGEAQSSSHLDVRCQKCGISIRGIRYKCMTCPDCDLCSDCERDYHKEHSMVYITTASDEGILHPGVRCDSCGTNIHGIRYKCRLCPDLDLCSDCEDQGFHKEHSMVKIKRPISNSKETKDHIHKGIRCDGCNVHTISGIRYKCRVCPDFDLCSECESKGRHKRHGMVQIGKPGDNIDDLHGRRHPGIMCDGCNHNIRGVRFKCRVCPDLDLCIICEDVGLHKEHSKVKISSPLPSTQTSRADKPDSDLHPGVTCNSCKVNIRGLRFKCRFCQNYDLCTSCHNKGIHIKHTKIKIEKPRQPTRGSPRNNPGHPIVDSCVTDARIPTAPPAQSFNQTSNTKLAKSSKSRGHDVHESSKDQERKKSANEDRMTCDICIERKKESFIIPCGHTLCTECAVAIENSKNKHCPFCRKGIQGIGKIFF